MSSYWPPGTVSEEAVRDSSRTRRGSLWQRPLRWGAVGEDRTTPWLGAIAGGRERVVSRADSRPMAWHPGPSATYVRSFTPAGFSPARTASSTPVATAPHLLRAVL